MTYPIPGSYLTPSRDFGFILHILIIIIMKRQNDPACVLAMCGVQSSRFFSFFFGLPCDVPVLSRYVSSLVAFDQLALRAHSLSRVQTQFIHALSLGSTHHSLPRTQNRLTFPCQEGYSTLPSTLNSSGSTPSFTFKKSVLTLSITFNVEYRI